MRWRWLVIALHTKIRLAPVAMARAVGLLQPVTILHAEQQSAYALPAMQPAEHFLKGPAVQAGAVLLCPEVYGINLRRQKHP